MKHQKFTLLAMALVTLGFLLTSPLIQADADVALGGALLLLLCVGPIIYWVCQGMQGMPLFELFAGMHLFYYWLAFGRDYAGSGVGKNYDSEPIWAVCVFLVAGMVCYYGVISRLRRGKQPRWKWLNLRAGPADSVLWAWSMLIAAVVFEFAVQSGLVWQFVDWESFRPVQTLFGAFAMLGVFRLTVELGAGVLKTAAKISLFALIAVLVALHTVSGYLAMAGLTAMVAGFGFMVSARRLPVMAFVVCLIIGSFLNLGKKEWRAMYWNTDEQSGIFERVDKMVHFSWLALTDLVARGSAETNPETLIERGNLGSVLYRVTSLTPRLVPYLNGTSYSYGLSLALLPRAFRKDQGDFQAAMTEAAIVYGFLTTMEVAQATNISFGPIAEAWMNGGWFVLILVGGFFGLFFALGVAMAWEHAIDSLGYLSGVFFFSTLFSAMELFVGSMLMAFTRNYPLALATLLALAFLQKMRRGTRRSRPRPALVPGPVPAEHPRPIPSGQ